MNQPAETEDRQAQIDLCDMVAEVCHEAVRAWQRRTGQVEHRPWSRVERELREESFMVVWRIFHDDLQSADEIHESWMGAKLRDGWRFGARRNKRSRRHPFLLPLVDLPAEYRKQQELVFAIATTLLNKEFSNG